MVGRNNNKWKGTRDDVSVHEEFILKEFSPVSPVTSEAWSTASHYYLSRFSRCSINFLRLSFSHWKRICYLMNIHELVHPVLNSLYLDMWDIYRIFFHLTNYNRVWLNSKIRDSYEDAKVAWGKSCNYIISDGPIIKRVITHASYHNHSDNDNFCRFSNYSFPSYLSHPRSQADFLSCVSIAFVIHIGLAKGIQFYYVTQWQLIWY